MVGEVPFLPLCAPPALEPNEQVVWHRATGKAHSNVEGAEALQSYCDVVPAM